MLINFSNHSSLQWTKQQLRAGNKYGDIIDLDFPVVDPKGDTEYIKLLAHQCADNLISILSHFKYQTNAAHVMGEPTLVYHVVQLLKKEGIICLASTTSRESVENDGFKTSKFTFCQFREY